MNKKFLLIASFAFLVYSCGSNETAKVETNTEEQLEIIPEEEKIDEVVEEVSEEVKKTDKVVKEKTLTAKEKAAEVKKAEENILNKGAKTSKEIEVKFDEEKLKKETEIKQAEEKILEGGARTNKKGIQ